MTIDKLNEISRIDLDLHSTSLNYNPLVHLDLSTDVIIKALISYEQKGRFLVENELLTVVLDNLGNEKTRRFKFDAYFERCKGRRVIRFDRKTNGDILKIVFDDVKFYYAISFPNNGKDFERLKQKVKELPNCRWNATAQHWGVPSTFEKEVLKFGRENRFLFKFEGSLFANNSHLVSLERSEIPKGLSFCDGRLSNKQDYIFNKDFWWCNGQPCYEKCDSIHCSDDWENYTLLDFCEILKLNTDSANKINEIISFGQYIQFTGLINRFNNLLEKLYCNDCKEILYPVENAHFAAHSVLRFKCANVNCTNKEEIYLNHCLNGQCNAIIDSRISKKCSNGLHICDNCGSCCSNDQMERRLNNLITVGGYIHSQLQKCVNEKLGHLERADYFCHKCATKMIEIKDDVFHCSQCNVMYDTKKYKMNRPLKEKVATHYPSKNLEDDIHDLIF